MTTTKHPLQAALDAIPLSQNKLADLSGVPQSVICQVINQSGGRLKFSADTAAKLLPHLQGRVTLQELIYPPGEIPESVAAPPAPAKRRRR